jgi:hypothetical protein
MSDPAAEVIERIGSPRSLTFNLRDWAILPKCWYPVARSDEFGDTADGPIAPANKTNDFSRLCLTVC